MNKICVLTIFVLFTMLFLNCWGSCKRNIYGKVILPDNSYSKRKVILTDNESNGLIYIDTLILTKDSTYNLVLQDPQNNCKNDCPQTTVPAKLKVSITDTTKLLVVLDTTFYCEKDYSFSGFDIVLPTLTIND